MNSADAGAMIASAGAFDVPAQAYPLGRWTLLKNPFGKRSKPLETAAPVQGELLLDMVKPVRNDLSDTDLEVVVPGSRQAAVRTPPSPTSPPSPVVPVLPAGPVVAEAVPESGSGLASGSGSAPAAWGRVKEQFFGVGKS